MSESPAATIPADVLRDARLAARSRAHPVQSAILGIIVGVPIGTSAIHLLATGQWGVLALLLLGSALTLWVLYRVTISYTVISHQCRSAFRREMGRRGWCAYCHEGHVYRACPKRRAAAR